MANYNNLGDKYKGNPMDVIDTLEDRLARQEANLNADSKIENRQTYTTNHAPVQVAYNVGYNAVLIKETKMDEVTEEKVLVAEDFKKYIGQIVNDTYNERYVEVIEVVGSVVAIQRKPYGAPELIEPRYLKLF